jgi:hypothetical protein
MPARKHFHWWYNWAVRSRLQPIKEVAGMLKRRFENIITYLRHQITNAASESLNAKQKREFAELRQSELKTARAWALKETAMALRP